MLSGLVAFGFFIAQMFVPHHGVQALCLGAAICCWTVFVQDHMSKTGK